MNELITRQCPICNHTLSLEVPREQVMAWLGGMLIQEAMPQFDAEQREFILTGICSEDCWDWAFNKNEEV